MEMYFVHAIIYSLNFQEASDLARMIKEAIPQAAVQIGSCPIGPVQPVFRVAEAATEDPFEEEEYKEENKEENNGQV